MVHMVILLTHLNMVTIMKIDLISNNKKIIQIDSKDKISEENLSILEDSRFQISYATSLNSELVQINLSHEEMSSLFNFLYYHF